MLKNPSNLGGIDLNLLYTFRVFAECKTVQATAVKLTRSQPAISARLHQLEADLGAQLFVRRGRRLQLTPFGRSFNTRLSDMFHGIQELVDQARASTSQPTGLLRVGALPTIGVFLLAPKIAAFIPKFPSVEIELRYGLVASNLEGLHRGHLDLVMGVGEPPDSDLDVVVIGTTKPVLVLRRGSQPLPSSPIRPEQLALLNWVAFGRIGDSFFDSVWDFMERHELQKRVQVRVDHIHTLKALVAAGVGASVLPDYTVIEPELEAREIEDLDLFQPIWMAARKSSIDIPLVAQFRDVVAST